MKKTLFLPFRYTSCWTYLVDIWSDQVVKFVENAVDHFNQEVALLVL